jgi:hypothetical protein
VNPDEASSYCCRTALLLPDEGGEAGMLGRRTRPRPLAGRVGGGGSRGRGGPEGGGQCCESSTAASRAGFAIRHRVGREAGGRRGRSRAW